MGVAAAGRSLPCPRDCCSGVPEGLCVPLRRAAFAFASAMAFAGARRIRARRVPRQRGPAQVHVAAMLLRAHGVRLCPPRTADFGQSSSISETFALWLFRFQLVTLSLLYGVAIQRVPPLRLSVGIIRVLCGCRYGAPPLIPWSARCGSQLGCGSDQSPFSHLKGSIPISFTLKSSSRCLADYSRA